MALQPTLGTTTIFHKNLILPLCRIPRRVSRLYSTKHFESLRKFSTSRGQEMRIATLQFAPKLGDVEGNIQRANEILNRGKLLSLGSSRSSKSKSDLTAAIEIERLRPDILILPELALTGTYQMNIIPCPPAFTAVYSGNEYTFSFQTCQVLKAKHMHFYCIFQCIKVQYTYQ